MYKSVSSVKSVNSGGIDPIRLQLLHKLSEGKEKSLRRKEYQTKKIGGENHDTIYLN